MTLLIDADWLIHSACAACETDVQWDEWIHTLHLEEGDAKEFITMRVDYWRDLTGDDQLVMCFSDYPTFRHEIHQNYKANRVGKRKPLGLKSIRQWVSNNYETRTHLGLEADDTMGLLSTSGLYRNPVIVSIDKDMRTVPGSLLATDTVETVSLTDANRNWMKQALTGDTSDNYPGLKGVGPVKAEQILGAAISLPEMWDKVVAAYQKAGFTLSDALFNARMSRILRVGDYDFAAGRVQLWDPDADVAMTAHV